MCSPLETPLGDCPDARRLITDKAICQSHESSDQQGESEWLAPSIFPILQLAQCCRPFHCGSEEMSPVAVTQFLVQVLNLEAEEGEEGTLGTGMPRCLDATPRWGCLRHRCLNEKHLKLSAQSSPMGDGPRWKFTPWDPRPDGEIGHRLGGRPWRSG